ncbi:subclass B3 metallo-beta-lactamase [Pedobacter panaciterrae]|jgi:Zn-dependent hydrolases, including glyoxylases|uniref:subclass B3 metallo-beta-lactamase n=1 Tax=Pedobacter panaciterrae TaxID=363849 RepID=UPI00155D915B|nr:subclass B3 metallo-beta-lactamase [Pedobacter panaciterrae]NQX53105.1 subclass B3 metallo-beta-lactamase [Pedobacter panaciterrae]
MFRHYFNTLTVILFFSSFLATAQQVKEPKDTPIEWSKSYQPFRIAGNLYYVGTEDLACYLIVTPKGNILINTGLATSLSVIKANVETLGFKFNDIKILLTTQAHYDHMGAMSAIKKATGAKFMVDEKDAAVAADGGSSDYALGGHGPTYEPIKTDRLLHNGDTVGLDDMKLVMLHHPGHTKGSCSFLFDVKDKDRIYKVLIANMPTIVTEKKFSEVTSYPEIAKDYAYTIGAMKKLTFDIWLSSHASQFGLHKKHKAGGAYNPNAFIDRKGYDKVLRDLEIQFSKKD